MINQLDHSVWAIRPESAAALKRMVHTDLGRVAELQRAIADPDAVQAAEARVRMAGPVDPEDLTRLGSIAILSLSGVIQPNPSVLSYILYGTYGGLQQFRAELRAALADDSIEAILLQIDSPGGSTALVQETAAELRAAAQVKPIIGIANTLAASAAYWIGSQATELAVTPSGYVGSIGVYMVHEDWSGWNAENGIVVTYVHAGEFKVEGNIDEPLSDAAKADWQSDVDAIHEVFLADVAAGRNTTAATVREDFGKGRILRAPDALAAGMVDRVATFEEVLADLTGRVDGAASAANALHRRGDDAKPDPSADAGDGDDTGDQPADKPERLTAADDFDVLAA